MDDIKKPGNDREEEYFEDAPDAMYYYCPHCKVSYDIHEEGIKPEETVCPICGEVYEEGQ